MTPEQRAQELINQYGDKALEVCSTVYRALKIDEATGDRQVAYDNIQFWWPVMQALGYDE